MQPQSPQEGPQDDPEPIAVVGMACRFSGEASSVEGLWQMLQAGRRGHCRVPESRYGASAWHHPSHERKGAINNDSGFFLQQDPSLFDAPFFSITAKEASGMDPVQRLLLEVSYEAFENAGCPLESLPLSRTGVFSGCMTNDYELLSTSDMYDMPHNSATGNGRAMLANRISWFFDLRGPSVMVDTACSSSLAALHLAVQALRSGECDKAMVTGASLILHPNFTQRLSYMHMLSSDGISHSFDAKANGYGRGEGIGAVLIKPLSAAIRDNDTIRAVIRTTGINQDGRTPGITMPSQAAQADLIRDVYKLGAWRMTDTTYFEAHGTGTGVGDPTELAAIGDTLGAARGTADAPLYVGSVKSNIGHTEGAAGVASLIKAVLCLENSQLVPVAGLTDVNPKLRLDEWRLKLCDSAIPWPKDLPERLSINSFGFGGANAHAILESFKCYLAGRTESTQAKSLSIRPENVTLPQIIVFSSYDKAGLARFSQQWSSALELPLNGRRIESIRNISYTMSQRRSRLPFRSFVVADSIDALQEEMKKGLQDFDRVSRAAAANLAFIFTGQGAQWAHMGESLLHIARFSESVSRSQDILTKLGCPWSVTDELKQDSSSSRLSQPDRSQAICCVLQIALVDLLRHWNIHPKAVVGHSSGEIGAAYAAGFITHEDAIKISYFRGVVSLQGRRGSMMAVGLSHIDVQPFLNSVSTGTVVIACVNSPNNVTLSGDEDKIDKLEQLIKSSGHFARKLRVERAYHSPHMQDVADDYKARLYSIAPAINPSTVVNMISSVTEKSVSADDLTADYWVRNMISPVQFAGAVTSLIQMTEPGKGRRRVLPVKWGAFIEVGPHEALKGPFTQSAQIINSSVTSVPYQSLLLRGRDAMETTLRAAGSLWCLGSTIDIEAVNASIDSSAPKVAVDLPSYPWNHQNSFWHEPRSSQSLRQRKTPRHDLLGVPLDHQNSHEPRWRNFLKVSEVPWLAEHVVVGSIVLPAAAMINMISEAARQIADRQRSLRGIQFNDVVFQRGVVVPDDDHGLEIAVHVHPHSGLPQWFQFAIFSLPRGGTWIQHSHGSFRLHYNEWGNALHEADWEAAVQRYRATNSVAEEKSIESVYRWLSQTGGVTLGTAFRSISKVAFAPARSSVSISGQVSDTRPTMPHGIESPYFVHPTTLDSLFQAAVLSCSESASNQNAVIPVKVEKLFLATDWNLDAGDNFVVHVENTRRSGVIRKDCIAMDPTCIQLGVVIQGIELGNVPLSTDTKAKGDGFAKNPFSSLVWSPVSLARTPWVAVDDHKPEIVQYKDLTHFIREICHTHGDARVFAIVDGSKGSVAASALMQFAPLIGQRPRMAQLILVIVGERLDKSPDLDSLRILIPEGDVQHVETLEQFRWDSLGESLFDVALLDLPQFNSLMNDPRIFSSIQKALLTEGTMIFHPDHEVLNGEPKALPEPEGLTVSGLTSDGNYVLAHNREAPAKPDETVYLLVEDPGSGRTAIEKALHAVLASVGIRSQTIGFHETDSLEDKICLSLLEIEKPWVSRWDENSMAHFRKLLRAKCMLWVSPIAATTLAADCAGGFSATTGLLRTLRNEYREATLVQVQFSESNRDSGHEIARGILRVLQITLSGSENRQQDSEYRLEGTQVLIPRVLPADSVTEAVRTLVDGPRARLSPLDQDTRALRYQNPVEEKDSGCWVEDTALLERLRPDHVEVDIKYQSIVKPGTNHQLAPEAKAEAVQAVGMIRQVGEQVTSGLSEADTVILLHPGDATASNLRTRLRVPCAAVARLPLGISPVEAADLPLAYTMAYLTLFRTARLGPESTILVVGRSDQTLRALLHYSLEMPWSQVFTAVDNETTADMIKEQYLISPDHVMTLGEGLDTRLASKTDGKGADIVVCSLGGSEARLAARCLALGGHYVDLSCEMNVAAIPQSVFSEGRTFSSINFNNMMNIQPHKVFACFQRAITSINPHGLVKQASALPVSKIPEAQNLSQISGLRVSVEFTSGDVPILPARPKLSPLPSGGVFILAGGLGTLGLAFAQTLVDCGVKHLIFLSRTGEVKDKHQITLDILNSRSCRTDVIQCDISDESECRELVAQVHREAWNIKGIVQCATVLRDAMFESMTYDEWRESTKPKMQGTLNLHNQFIDFDIEHFIVLSSVASLIGNMGQANYSSGNAYMDGLMEWRRSHGLAGQSINIGLVPDASGTGEVEESAENRRQRFSHLSGTEISTKELQTLFQVLLQHAPGTPTQLNVGMTDDIERKDASSWVYDRKFDHRVQFAHLGGTSGAERTSVLLKQAKSVDEATSLVIQALQQYLAKFLSTTAESIDLEMPLLAFGVDSLRATEVQAWIHRELGCQLASFELLGSQPVRELSVKITSESSFVSCS